MKMHLFFLCELANDANKLFQHSARFERRRKAIDDTSLSYIAIFPSTISEVKLLNLRKAVDNVSMIAIPSECSLAFLVPAFFLV